MDPFLIPILTPLFALGWMLVSFLFFDCLFFGAALGIISTFPLVAVLLFFAALRVSLFPGEVNDFLIAAYLFQFGGALAGQILQSSRRRRKKNSNRGKRDPAYEYIDE
jgi:hypothetical protein